MSKQTKGKSMKKKIYKYVLSVDFGGGDGAELFPIEKSRIDKSKRHIDSMFTELLFASYPPPKVEVIGLTKAEWKTAERAGRE